MFAGAGLGAAILLGGTGYLAYKGLALFTASSKRTLHQPARSTDERIEGVFDPAVVDASHRKDWSAAVSRLEELVAGDVSNETLRHALGVCLYNLASSKMDEGGATSLDEAGRRLQRSALFLANDPAMSSRVWQDYAGLGVLESDAGRQAQGKAKIVEANRRTPKDPYISYVLGATYMEEGKYTEALAFLEVGSLSQDESVRSASSELLAKVRGDVRQEQSFSVHQSSGFVIRYEGEEKPEMAERVIAILKAEGPNVRSVVGAIPANAVEVILYTSDRFAAERGLPDWAGGVYDGRIRAGRGDAESPRFRSILAHEYAHAAVHSVGGRRVPVWMNEGIAQVVQYGPAPPEMKVTGTAPSISRLNSSFLGLGRAEASAAYGASYLAVSFIARKYGSGAIPAILSDIAKGTSPAAALKRITGLTESELDAAVAGKG